MILFLGIISKDENFFSLFVLFFYLAESYDYVFSRQRGRVYGQSIHGYKWLKSLRQFGYLVLGDFRMSYFYQKFFIIHYEKLIQLLTQLNIMLIMQILVVLQFIKLIDVVIVFNVIEAYKDNFIMSNPELKHKLNLKSSIDPKSVHSSQLNSSSSKMQYTMPKSARFSQKKINSSSDAFYEIPDTKSKRSASFGYGNKMDLGKRNFQTPSPYLYNIPSEFNDKKKGITISAGREIIKNNSVFSAVTNIPGPGQYNPKNPIIDKSGKQGFTIGCKTEDKTDQWKTKLPGPGNYETLELLDKNLKSSNSRIQNPRSGRFSKSRRVSDFQQSQTKKNPGPGQYDKAFNIEATAKFQSKGGYHFSHSQRQGIIGKSRHITPGPGSYGSFSQFIS